MSQNRAPTTLTTLLSRVRLPYRVWNCATCNSPGQLTYRAAGWVVMCPCPICPAPPPPEHRGNPTVQSAIRHWNWLQGGPK